MFYIIENTEQFQEFKEISVKNHFVYPIYDDDRVFPSLNRVIAVYVYSYHLHKSFILSISHPDCGSIPENEVVNWIKTLNKVYTFNGRKLLHWIGLDIISTIVDLKFYDKLLDVPELPQIKWYYDTYVTSYNVNKIIPIVLHKKGYDQLLDRIEVYDDFDYNLSYNKMLYVFYMIEINGLTVDLNKFKELYEDIDFKLNTKDSKIFSWYNLYNKTTRPTNNFNTINFAALQQDNGIRNAILAEPDSILVEFDFRAYHMYLLADLMDFEINENPYIYLAKHYFNTDNPTPEQYQQSKQISYQAIYTESTKYKHIDYIARAKEYKEKIFSEYTGTTVTKGQILSHKLQQVETERNVDIIANVLNVLGAYGNHSKIILYTYDSILLNIPKSNKGILPALFDTINHEKFPVKLTYGANYGEMKEF